LILLINLNVFGSSLIGIDIALKKRASMKKERENKEVRMIPGPPTEGMGGASARSRVLEAIHKEEM
jgi:hypothetical protein